MSGHRAQVPRPVKLVSVASYFAVGELLRPNSSDDLAEGKTDQGTNQGADGF